MVEKTADDLEDLKELKEENEVVPTDAEVRIKKARLFSWIFMGLTVIALFLNVLLCLTMYQMGSRLTVMTQLFNTTRGTSTLVLSDVLNQNLGDLELLQKMFVHRFIEERNFSIPDDKEMQYRWGPYGELALMSTRKIWRPVYRHDDDRIKELKDSLPTHADNINIISHVGNTWLVDFDFWTHGKTGSMIQKRRVSVKVDFDWRRAQKVATAGYYYNPLGMVVTEYYIVPSEQ